MTKTLPVPFNLSSSKRQKIDDATDKKEFIPLKVQVEQVFHNLREDDATEMAHSGKQS